MYLQVGLSAMIVISGLFANLLTVKAKTVVLDNDSIGSQERYYRTWATPVYMWCLHYSMMIAFISAVLYTLFKTGCAVEGQTETFDEAVKVYEKEQLAQHTNSLEAE